MPNPTDPEVLVRPCVGLANRCGYCIGYRGRLTRWRVLLARQSFVLSVLVNWLAFFDERRHALESILQREGCVKQVAFNAQPFGKRRFECAIDGAFSHRRGGS